MPRVYKKTAPLERFWKTVNTNGPVHPILGTRCWIRGEIPPDATYYGKILIHAAGGPVSVGAHCFSWEIHNGPIPDELCVLHRCDIRPCVNPSHLFLGTKGDNIRDASAKGRHAMQTRTHCPKGHPLSGDNLVLRNAKGRVPWRDCKTCHRVRELARVHAKPGEMVRKAQMAREWRVRNPEKKKAADIRHTIRRRERNLAQRRAMAEHRHGA